MENLETHKAVILLQRGIMILAKPPGLKAADALLLWHLVKVLPMNGDTLSLKVLADVLALARPTVTVGMQTLLKANLVMRGPKVGKLYLYKLNPAIFHHL